MPPSENISNAPKYSYRRAPHIFSGGVKIVALLTTLFANEARLAHAEDSQDPPKAAQKANETKPEKKETMRTENLWERKGKIPRGTVSWILVQETTIENGEEVVTERKVNICVSADGKFLVIDDKLRASCSCLGFPIEMGSQEVMTKKSKKPDGEPMQELEGEGMCLGYGKGKTILTPETLRELVRKMRKGEEYMIGVKTIGDEFEAEATFTPVKGELRKE